MFTKYEWSSQEDTMEDAAAIQKQNIYAHLKLQNSTWMFHSATGNIFCGLEKTG